MAKACKVIFELLRQHVQERRKVLFYDSNPEGIMIPPRGDITCAKLAPIDIWASEVHDNQDSVNKTAEESATLIRRNP
jgi:hypothetical protein